MESACLRGPTKTIQHSSSNSMLQTKQKICISRFFRAHTLIGEFVPQTSSSSMGWETRDTAKVVFSQSGRHREEHREAAPTSSTIPTDHCWRWWRKQREPRWSQTGEDCIFVKKNHSLSPRKKILINYQLLIIIKAFYFFLFEIVPPGLVVWRYGELPRGAAAAGAGAEYPALKAAQALQV